MLQQLLVWHWLLCIDVPLMNTTSRSETGVQYIQYAPVCYNGITLHVRILMCAYVCTCMHSCIHKCMCVCLCLCVRTCVRACVRVLVHMFEYLCMRAFNVLLASN